MARDTTFQKESESSDSGLSLALRLQQGVPEAWNEMVTLYGPLVDRWCRAAGVAPDAIPDVAQDAFLSAFRGLSRFTGDHECSTFRGWLWTVVRSRIVDHYRRMQRHVTARGGSTALERIHELPDPVPAHEPTEPDHWAALLHRAMDQIQAEFEPGTWDMFWRATVLGHPADLIASEQNVTAATVRQAKSRVLRRLRRQLGDAPQE